MKLDGVIQDTLQCVHKIMWPHPLWDKSYAPVKIKQVDVVLPLKTRRPAAITELVTHV